MPNLSRILVPVEFSPRCLGAAQYAEALSCHFHCEIVLLHVVNPPLASFSSFGIPSHTSAHDLARQITEQRTAELDAFPCSPPEGVTVRRMVREGDPTQTIVEVACSEKCDLIVMPTHGYGPFRRFLLGSVTAKVLHDATCPVWTGPHMEQAPDYSKVHFRNVLCAIDLEPHTREVLCWGAGFAREFGAQFVIVHAIPVPVTRLGGYYFDSEWHIRLAKTAAERIAFLRQDMGINATVVVEAGDPASVVTTTARAMEADLVVIGRGSRPHAHRHLPTHSYAIVRESPCTVASV